MAVIYLTKNNQSEAYGAGYIWEKKVAVASGETSDPIMLPDEAGAREYWQLSLLPAAGTGRFEYSLSSRETIKAAPSSANWQAWDSGNVAILTDDSLTPVQAVRVVSVSGAVTGEIMVL